MVELGDARVLVTGGTGSWGQELVRQMLALPEPPARVRVYSRGEHKQVEMRRRFQDARLDFLIGDVRDAERTLLATKGMDVVFHLAALKHVPVCEDNPWEAVQTNVVGAQNVITAAIECGVRRVVNVSTDKAVDPFNLYGVTKACGERLFVAANRLTDETGFVCVRGGNVVGSNGSVVPLFKEQIRRTNEVTLTDERMTRFFLRLDRAVALVLDAVPRSVGGEVFVMKMPAARITQLARLMAQQLGDAETCVRTIGIRPGEKISEVLVSRYEAARTVDGGDFWVVLPQIDLPRLRAHYDALGLPPADFESYSSETTHQLADDEIASLLATGGWLDEGGEQEALQYLRSLSAEDLSRFFESEGWVRREP